MTTKTTTKPPNAAGQWWKAWVLLTGIGATVIGWWALPGPEPPPDNGTSPSQVSIPAENALGVGVERVGRLRGVPVKPVFQTPVTRTRRS